MPETLLRSAALLATASLFGGMLLFAAGFAAFQFTALPVADARALIRKAFPPFYLVAIAGATAAALLCAAVDPLSAGLMALVASSTVPLRQLLMPAINAATDSGNRRRFAQLHGLSVVATSAHIVVAAAVLLRLAH